MSSLDLIDACLVGFFGFATLHYGIQWWFSRSERILLVFAVLCALYTAFTWTMLARRAATTIADAQIGLDRNITLGVLVWGVLLHLYGHLSKRRDRVFRALLYGVIAFLVIWHQWMPLRGTVIELQPMSMPGGGTSLLPIRTPPGVPLLLFYLASQTINAYGFIAAHAMWKRDRWGAVLIVVGALMIVAGGLVALLIDVAHLRAPYLGAFPHAFFVLSMAIVLAREYSARAAREAVANRHFETVFEHSPVGKALFAPGGEVIRVNHALCRILGTTAEELTTRRLQDFTDLDDDVQSRLRSGELPAYAVEKCFPRKDGEPAWVLVAVSLVPDDHGRPTRIIAQMQDVTELRAHREELERLVATRTAELRDAKSDADRANAAKSQFLANMSHEIRNSLGVIMLYAQLLQRDPDLDEPQKKKSDAIFSSGKHLLTLLNEVLEMSKIEAGRAELVEERFDPSVTLDEIEQMFAVQSAAKGIALAIDRAAGLPRSLLADVAKVKQILINLVGNAVKFTKQGTIRVTASADTVADAIRVTIVVADTGIGIAAPDLERMFLPFEQLASGARAGGTGLGLAISLTHARLMHGDLTATSALGVGTTFTFTFIAKATRPLSAAREPAPLVATTQRKILIVDDEKHNRDILAEILSKTSFETRDAANGRTALAIAADWVPDLVLMDLRMPEMDGLEAIRRMRAEGSKAAIGVLTANALASDEEEALTLGADFFLRKPYGERELLERISSALADRVTRSSG